MLHCVLPAQLDFIFSFFSCPNWLNRGVTLCVFGLTMGATTNVHMSVDALGEYGESYILSKRALEMYSLTRRLRRSSQYILMQAASVYSYCSLVGVSVEGVLVAHTQ